MAALCPTVGSHGPEEPPGHCAVREVVAVQDGEEHEEQDEHEVQHQGGEAYDAVAGANVEEVDKPGHQGEEPEGVGAKRANCHNLVQTLLGRESEGETVHGVAQESDYEGVAFGRDGRRKGEPPEAYKYSK